MYVTGSVIDFASRLHQLPTGTAELTSFQTEGKDYLATYTVSGITYVESGKWEREARLKGYSITNNPTYLTTQVF